MPVIKCLCLQCHQCRFKKKYLISFIFLTILVSLGNYMMTDNTWFCSIFECRVDRSDLINYYYGIKFDSSGLISHSRPLLVTFRADQTAIRAVCPPNLKFLVYVYNLIHNPGSKNAEVTSSLVNDLQLGDSWTNDPASACIFVVVVGLWRDTISSGDVSTVIHSLPHWKEYSHKHVLVELSHSNSNSRFLQQIETNSARIATSYFPTQKATHTLIPPVVTPRDENIVIPPTECKFSLYFEGELEGQQRSEVDSKLFGVCEHFSSNSSCAFKCSASRERGALEREWSLCNTATDRLAKCQKALFALVPCGMEGEVGPVTFTRLIEALQCGAVPIVVGDCVNRLPFSEVIEWKEAAIFVLPEELSPDLIYSSQRNIRHYRERGLFLYTTYFSSGLKIVESLIAIIRTQSHHPPMWYRDYIPEVLLNTMPRTPTVSPPVQPQYPQQLWNSPPGPFYSHTYISERYFAVGNGMVETQLSTKLFERFTIVILTYHREWRISNVLGRLKDCPFLDKVVIVWNNEPTYKHPKEYRWPNIGVPIEVVRADVNSLNNRFLPFSNIETEAILSLDDDVCLTQKDIVQGFRVWQDHRTAIVGWMSRTHNLHVSSTQSGEWSYTYDYYGMNCEYSMVITNGAFLHKYYTYLYTYWMPERVRTHVHTHMNCEDIAMNFLVSHITRRPPVTIGDKKTPECSQRFFEKGISQTGGHMEKRSLCLREFEIAYGYMPLLESTYQVVSPWCKPDHYMYNLLHRLL